MLVKEMGLSCFLRLFALLVCETLDWVALNSLTVGLWQCWKRVWITPECRYLCILEDKLQVSWSMFVICRATCMSQIYLLPVVLFACWSCNSHLTPKQQGISPRSGQYAQLWEFRSYSAPLQVKYWVCAVGRGSKRCQQGWVAPCQSGSGLGWA